MKMSQYSQENTCVGVSFYNFIRKAPTQVFSSKYCEIFKNNFHRTPPVTASV